MEAELIITNLTDQEVNNVMVLHKHSGNLQWTSATPEGKAENGAYAWFFDSIGPRQVKTIKATGMSPSEGVVNGCTTVTYDIGVCSSTRVTQPKLRLVKTGPAEVMACDDIVYQFEVTNTGTGTLYERQGHRSPARGPGHSGWSAHGRDDGELAGRGPESPADHARPGRPGRVATRTRRRRAPTA